MFVRVFGTGFSCRERKARSRTARTPVESSKLNAKTCKLEFSNEILYLFYVGMSG